MFKRHTNRISALFLAILLCVSVMVPFAIFAEDDELISNATAPLKSITANEGYTLSPTFSQNTRVYTLFKTTGADITDKDSFESAIAVSEIDAADTQVSAYTKRLGLYEITNTNANGATKYYISYGGEYVAGEATPVATINMLKVLQTEYKKGTSDYEKLDFANLDFKFKLTSIGTVENTTPATYDTTAANPLPADGATNSGNENEGSVTVTNQETYAEMLLDNWDGSGVSVVSDSNLSTLAADEDLVGRPFIQGAFSIGFEEVGQYKYILEEIIPDNPITGITYDVDKYEIIVSVVNADPSNPNTNNLKIGWIEVSKIDLRTYDDIDDTDYEKTKVNFGTGDTPVDGIKYDNSTTVVTYPFVNVLATDNLHISKTVTGDLGDIEQDFLFKVTIKGQQLAPEYAITYAGPNSESSVQPDTTLGNGDGDTVTDITVYFTLKHGANATIYGLPVGATYTVEELTANAGGLTVANVGEAANYNTTVTYDSEIVDGTPKTVKQSVIAEKALGDSTATTGNPTILDIPAGDGFNKFNAVEYVNDKPLTPPTGAFVDMIPYIAIVIVAIGGFVTFVVVRKNNRVYED